MVLPFSFFNRGALQAPIPRVNFNLPLRIMRLLGLGALLACAVVAVRGGVSPLGPSCTVILTYADQMVPITESYTNGVCRYTVRYAKAERWLNSVATTDAGACTTSLPPSCPQESPSLVAGTGQSEDCLYAVIYAPITIERQLPIFTWIHGGSFKSGSASAPGLDGSRLAKQGMIVVVLQYRLGVLGLLPPSVAPGSEDPNLAIRDVLRGLEFIKTHAAVFRGDPNSITVGGQSSGAGLVRTLWSTPGAAGLVSRVILQSDPLTYGLAPPRITGILQRTMSDALGCSDWDCFRNLPLDTIMSKQKTLVSNAPLSIPGVPLAEPLRPTFGTATVTSDPVPALLYNPGELKLNPKEVPLLITFAVDDGAATVGQLLSTPTAAAQETYLFVLNLLVGTQKEAVAAAYPLVTTPDTTTADDVLRKTLSTALTDGGWRCISRLIARSWAEVGGKVYLGEFQSGATYPLNANVPFCNGRVCHQDDIYPTFGTAPSSTFNVLAEWTSFITGSAPWAAYTTTGTVGQPLGGTAPLRECPAGVWGSTLQWDFQMYGS